MWLCCFSSLENVSNLSIIFKSIISLILLIIPVLQMWWKHKQEIIKLPLESWNYWVKQDTKMFYLTPCPIDFYAFSVLWTKCRRVMFKKYWLDCYVCVCVCLLDLQSLRCYWEVGGLGAGKPWKNGGGGVREEWSQTGPKWAQTLPQRGNTAVCVCVCVCDPTVPALCSSLQ